MTIDEKYAIRHATVDDIPTIVSHRRRMFAEMGYGVAEALDAMDEAGPGWLRKHIEAGTYIGFLMVGDDAVVGGAGLYLIDWPPNYMSSKPYRPFVYNVYVEQDFRSQGIARRLMEAIIQYCRDEGYDDVSLHSSVAGRPLYESMGFKPTNEMRLNLT